MRKRPLLLLLPILLLCLLAGFLYLRKSPPALTRLLPESDAIVYLNLAPIRAATHFDKSPVPPSPAYQQFIDATGIQPERDLDQAAFALTRLPDPSGPNGPVAFSELFAGHFDTPRLTRYLAAQAQSQEIYATHTIYNIPSETRTLRVTLLDDRTIAASNAPTPEQLHSILDRAHTTSLFSSNVPSLLSALYPDVPTLSSAWAIGHIALPFAEDGAVSVAGLHLPIPADGTFIASLRFTTALHLRIDQLTVSQSDAEQITQSLTNLLSLAHALPKDSTLTPLLDAIQVESHKDRATLSATLPYDLLKHLTHP